eukprot:TRINITY_DN5318_c0_g1_i1.p1 TRINITY_DN5318_c0_g1~~TRINITY_DN5318_c0_g1_i1.p1  ORF type:complete len:357 (-),score=63.28 TRINITY_DN5318_c0_g1_i1:7-1077(-)
MSFSRVKEDKDASIMAGMPIEIIFDVVDSYRRSFVPAPPQNPRISIPPVWPPNTSDSLSLSRRNQNGLRSLEIELGTLSLAAARHYGLDKTWTKRLADAHARERSVLMVIRSVAGSPASQKLKEGDLILACDDSVVTTFRQLEVASMFLPRVKLTILRVGGSLQEILVSTVPMYSIHPMFPCSDESTGNRRASEEDGGVDEKKDLEETDCQFPDWGLSMKRYMLWCGAFLQDSYRELGFQQRDMPLGVFCGRYCHGSPAEHYNLKAQVWILKVNKQKTPDLDSFRIAISQLPPNEFVRLKTIGPQSKIKIVTIKPNLHFWPTILYQYSHIALEWQLIVLSSSFLKTNSETPNLIKC